MLKKLFKRQEVMTVEQVRALSTHADRARLEQLARQADPDVRAAALAHLGDVDFALQAFAHPNPIISEAARAILIDALLHHRMDDGKLASLTVEQRFGLLFESQPERATQWLTEQPEAVVLQLALQAARAPERHLAAAFLQDEEALQQVQRAAKGHDNGLYKIVKARLAEARAERRALEERQAQLARLQENLQRLVHSPYDPLLEGKFLHQQQQLAELEPNTDEQAIFDPIIQQVQTRIENEQAAETLAQQAADEQQSATQEALRVLADTTTMMRRQLALYLEDGRLLPDDWATSQTWLEKARQAHRAAIERLQVAPAMNADVQKTSQWVEQTLQRLHDITARWGGMSAALASAEDDDAEALAALRALLEPLQKHQQEPGEWPESVTQVAAKLGTVAASQAEHQEAEVQAVRKVRGLLRRGRGAIRAGHLRQARGIWHSVEEALVEVPTGHDALHQEVADFLAELEQLGDWQSFAVLPKKQALIEQMQALIERSMHPKDKADAVQQLQNEWRTLSRGDGGQHQTLWEQFHALADDAFAPCKEYFAEQDKLMALNASKRRELIGQLTQYAETNDWHNPDWAEVEKVLRLAGRDWRHYTPVKPQDFRTTERDYREIVERIRKQLDLEFERNKSEREQIIAAAEALREEPDLRRATEELKRLQQAWKNAGRTHRQDDRRLWLSFRSICDEVFERRNVEQNAASARMEHHVRAAEELIKRVEQAAQGDEKTVAVALQQLSEWEAEFGNCAPLPKAQAPALKAQFTQAVDALKHARQRRRQTAEIARWDALFERLAELAESEHHAWQGKEVTVNAEQRTAWTDVAELPKVAARILPRVQALHASDAAHANAESNVHLHHRHCVLMEILVGISSPESDTALRMEIQVERLAEGMGQHNTEQAMQDALEQWLLLPGYCPPDHYQDFHERIRRAVLHYFFK